MDQDRVARLIEFFGIGVVMGVTEDLIVVAVGTNEEITLQLIGIVIGTWSSKALTGYVVKENLKSLLQTATSEQLHWRQVYWAAEALEKFTQGSIRFAKHLRHGWMLIGDGKIVNRLRGRSLSAGTR